MKRIIKAELFKMTRRKEFVLVVCSLLLSLGLPIAFSLAPQSFAIDYAFGDKIPLIAYSSLGYAFWGAIGVFTLLFSLLAVGLSSAEIESHYFYLYFPKVDKRGNVYKSKMIVLIVFSIVWYCVYTLLLNPVGYAILNSVRPDIASGEFSDGSHVYWACMWLIYLLEITFYISLTLAFGSKFKPLSTIALILIVFYGSMFFYEMPVIKYILPEFYKQKAISCESITNYEPLLKYVVLYFIVVMVYDVLLYIFGKRRTVKLDA